MDTKTRERAIRERRKLRTQKYSGTQSTSIIDSGFEEVLIKETYNTDYNTGLEDERATTIIANKFSTAQNRIELWLLIIGIVAISIGIFCTLFGGAGDVAI